MEFKELLGCSKLGVGDYGDSPLLYHLFQIPLDDFTVELGIVCSFGLLWPWRDAEGLSWFHLRICFLAVLPGVKRASCWLAPPVGVNSPDCSSMALIWEAESSLDVECAPSL